MPNASTMRHAREARSAVRPDRRAFSGNGRGRRHFGDAQRRHAKLPFFGCRRDGRGVAFDLGARRHDRRVRVAEVPAGAGNDGKTEQTCKRAQDAPRRSNDDAAQIPRRPRTLEEKRHSEEERQRGLRLDVQRSRHAGFAAYATAAITCRGLATFARDSASPSSPALSRRGPRDSPRYP